ncbi:MAG: cyclic lactone autoinducer peptide [Clostridiaceae bacterium]|nr:cyclic lactone autoinducer peptide [Clostridiaceae bacterium]
MKNIKNYIMKNSLGLLAFLALIVGTTSISTNSMFLIHQVKCPEELLK